MKAGIAFSENCISGRPRAVSWSDDRLVISGARYAAANPHIGGQLGCAELPGLFLRPGACAAKSIGRSPFSANLKV